MADGQKITFTSEGDQEPGLEPGDIIIVLDEKAHDTFRRSGQDLILKMDITLTEALTGAVQDTVTVVVVILCVGLTISIEILVLIEDAVTVIIFGVLDAIAIRVIITPPG